RERVQAFCEAANEARTLLCREMEAAGLPQVFENALECGRLGAGIHAQNVPQGLRRLRILKLQRDDEERSAAGARARRGDLAALPVLDDCWANHVDRVFDHRPEI